MIQTKTFRFFLTGFFLASCITNAEVVQHTENFSIDASNDGKIHYFGKLSDWSHWIDSGNQNWGMLDKNPIYTAFKAGMSEVEVQIPSLAESQRVLGTHIGLDFSEVLEPRRVRLEKGETIEPVEDRAYVYHAKLSKLVDSSIESFDVDEVSFMEVLNKADAPHTHTQVDREFVKNSLEGLHANHQKIDDRGVYFHTFVGLFEYGCDFMLNSLATAADWAGQDVRRVLNDKGEEEPAFNLHLINKLTKANSEELEAMSGVFSKKPDVMFVQDILYNSFMIKAGKIYWAFFNEGGGKTRIVNYSAVALTKDAPRGRKLLLYGTSLSAFNEAKDNRSVDIEAQDAAKEKAANILAQLNQGLDDAKQPSNTPIANLKDIVVTSNWSNLANFKPEDRICPKGLGLGLPGYTFTGFEKVLSEIAR